MLVRCLFCSTSHFNTISTSNIKEFTTDFSSNRMLQTRNSDASFLWQPNKWHWYGWGIFHTLQLQTFTSRSTDDNMWYWVEWNSSTALYLHSECAWSKSQPGHSYMTKTFPAFHQSLQENVGIVPQIGHDHFFPDPFQFISHPTTWCYIVSILT